MKKTQIEKVRQYYNSSVIDYKLLWTGPKDLAIHFGYYTNDIKNHNDSLLKMNEVLAKLVDISPKDIVLDAGCGYGGSSIWLATHIGCKVTGLNIVPYQLKKAKEYAEKFNISNKVDFQNQDYSHSSFQNESFDVVWGLESIVHAENKENFIKEAFRLLKKKGRIIIAEYMLRDNPSLSNKETESLKPWLAGWAMPTINSKRI